MKTYVKPVIEQTELLEASTMMLSMSDSVNPGKDTNVLAPGFRKPFGFGGGFEEI